MLSLEEAKCLGQALNESSLLGATVDTGARSAKLVLSVLTLPETGPEPDDPCLEVTLFDVTRVRASLRLGDWNGWFARVVPFPLSQLDEIVQGFGGSPIYGWEFFNVREVWYRRLWPRASVDERLGKPVGSPDSLTVFQEEVGRRYLELSFWFEGLEFAERNGTRISTEAVIAGGKRWWDAFYLNDPRTKGHGMAPLS